MTVSKILAVAALGLSAAACSSTTYETHTAGAYPVSSSERACLDYGFRAGTDAFAECLQRIDLDRRASLRQSSREALFLARPVVIVHERRD